MIDRFGYNPRRVILQTCQQNERQRNVASSRDFEPGSDEFIRGVIAGRRNAELLMLIERG
jgi:hypothetical protein